MRMLTAALASFLILAAGCEQGKETGQNTPTPSAVALSPGQIQTVQARKINPAFELTGITRAYHSARVTPQVQARLIANHFEGGEMVEEGQLLVEL